jgi:hypothetical protein
MARSSSSTAADTSPLTPLLTRAQLEEDLVTVYAHLIFLNRMLVGEDEASAGLVHKPLPATGDLTSGADDLGLTFADIAHAEFVQTFLWMYDFAYFGRLHADAEPMGDETGYTRAAAFAFDLQTATLPVQILQDGAPIAARRLTQIAETANARHLLEGGHEPFFYFGHGGELELPEEGWLTVRQIALLAGMSEPTIRTLANPKRSDALKTENEGGRTRIKLDVARAWLQKKKRYVPVRRVWSGAGVDLADVRLYRLADLVARLNRRLEQLSDERPGGLAALRQRLEKARPAIPFSVTHLGLFLDLEPHHFADAALVTALAAALELPAPLITLRARELIAREELALVQRELEALRQPSVTE